MKLIDKLVNDALNVSLNYVNTVQSLYTTIQHVKSLYDIIQLQNRRIAQLEQQQMHVHQVLFAAAQASANNQRQVMLPDINSTKAGQKPN